MNNSMKTRFAPSPTGHMHIGNVRTALFAWLFARSQGGQFLLRIEDTDLARSTDEYIQNILDDLRWLGLDWDEFYRQSERRDLHNQRATQLLDEGKAYRCYCTAEEFEKRREEQIARGEKPKYDRRCRDLSPKPESEPYAIRLKLPQEGSTQFEDLIFGSISISNEELDDFVLVRRDGTPTFNFACALDDHDMGITHVIRGDDHLSNTPKQIHVYRAFGFPEPCFGHLSTILGADKTRLSKRHGATSIDWYRTEGYLPEAMINYLVRLGWSFGDEEFFTPEMLVKKFSLDNVNRSAAVFNPEKLVWLSAEHIRQSEPLVLWNHLRPFLEEEGLVTVCQNEQGRVDGVYLCPSQWGEGSEARSLDWVAGVIETLQPRSKTLLEMRDRGRFYFVKNIEFDEKAVRKHLKSRAKEPLTDLLDGLEKMQEPFDEQALEQLFTHIMEKHEIKLLKLAMPTRVALTGLPVSPGIFETVRSLGKQTVLDRLKAAIEML